MIIVVGVQNVTMIMWNVFHALCTEPFKASVLSSDKNLNEINNNHSEATLKEKRHHCCTFTVHSCAFVAAVKPFFTALLQNFIPAQLEPNWDPENISEEDRPEPVQARLL